MSKIIGYAIVWVFQNCCNKEKNELRGMNHLVSNNKTKRDVLFGLRLQYNSNNHDCWAKIYTDMFYVL